MITLAKSRFGLAACMGFFLACASSNQEAAQAPRSDDLLELLTGFGESISKRNFDKAVDYMVPEEKAMMLEGGTVPPDKQKMLMALPLQRMIRNPSIHVENGHIAGIYGMLPNLRQGEAASDMAAAEPESADSTLGAGPMGEGPMAADAAEAADDETASAEAAAEAKDAAQLKAAVNKFFAAVNRKNWAGALALMNEGERRLLVDDKGRIKESAKQRLAQMDQKNPEALTLQDGKLTGVTLLLPSSAD
jgi:hypothetical protein